MLVDTCKKIKAASNFFTLLERMSVFLSSSVPHSSFLNKQAELGQHKQMHAAEKAEQHQVVLQI